MLVMLLLTNYGPVHVLHRSRTRYYVTLFFFLSFFFFFSLSRRHQDHSLDFVMLTLVLLRVFPKHIFLRGVVATPLWIINTEGHITLNLLPVYRYGHPLSIDTKISTNH